MNTDDYEGHTPGPWRWDFQAILQGKETVLWCDFLEPDPDWQLHNSAIHVSEKDEMLIAAAPDLLAEVKRLSGLLKANGCCIACGKHLGQCNDEDECIRLGGWTMEEAKELFE